MGAAFNTKAIGLGDLSLNGIYRIFATADKSHQVMVNFGVSLPTGSIDEKAATPADPNGLKPLPYPMQLGSGTYDLLPGLTYKGFTEKWSWGGQVRGMARMGRNNKNYSLGNRFQVMSWGSYLWEEWLSTSAGLDWQSWGTVDGADVELNQNLVQTADPTIQGGRRLDLKLGVNFVTPYGPLKGNRLAVEFALPIHQNLDGPQIETDWILTAGWQLAF